MSTALISSTAQEALAYLQKEVRGAWKDILDRSFGSTAFTLIASILQTSPEDPLCFSYAFVPAQFGSVTFTLERSVALSLGYRLLAVKGRASEHDHHAVYAISHLMNQLASSLSDTVSSRLNTNIQATELPEPVDAPPSPDDIALTFSGTENDTYMVTVSPCSVLLAAFADPSPPPLSGAAGASALPAPRNLDLLLDLEMPVTISFGTTRLPLKEIAKFTTGSVVELNRPISEPVEVVVNNCSIARGEVVVIDGNFAVRIKQVMSKQDRIRSLA